MHLLEHGGGRGMLVVVAMLGFGLGVLGTWPASHPHPHRGRVIVTETETTILDVVEFDAGTATLRPSSQPILDAVAATLIGNPSITLVEVQSHTSGVGAAAANLALSEQRAKVIVAYLVAAGVESSRLVAQGYGDTQPIDRASPAKNERVSFLILTRLADR